MKKHISAIRQGPLGSRVIRIVLSLMLLVYTITYVIVPLPVIAWAKPGSQQDPLVTRSYVDNLLEGKFGEQEKSLEAVAQKLTQLEQRLAPLIAKKLVPFKDVEGHWALENIKLLKTKGIISGFEDGTFRPEGQVTRAQLTVMLVRAKGLKVKPQPKKYYTDVKSDFWAYKEIAAAKEAGLISPNLGTSFQPNLSATRELIADMVNRSFKPTAIRAGQKFSDINKSWAKTAIVALNKGGVIDGYPDNTYRPQKPVTRAEISAMFIRAIDPQYRLKK